MGEPYHIFSSPSNCFASFGYSRFYLLQCMICIFVQRHLAILFNPVLSTFIHFLFAVWALPIGNAQINTFFSYDRAPIIYFHQFLSTFINFQPFSSTFTQPAIAVLILLPNCACATLLPKYTTLKINLIWTKFYYIR